MAIIEDVGQVVDLSEHGLTPGGVVHYPGNYDDYLAARGIV